MSIFVALTCLNDGGDERAQCQRPHPGFFLSFFGFPLLMLSTAALCSGKTLPPAGQRVQRCVTAESNGKSFGTTSG